MKGNICLVSNTGWYLFNFKSELILDLKKKGYELNLVCPRDKYSLFLKEKGFKIHYWDLKSFSINPINEIISIIKLHLIYKKIKPDLVHHFTVKPIMYGSIVSSINKIPNILNSITGLGHIFLSKNFKAYFIRKIIVIFYKIYLNKKQFTTIFQNFSDKELFTKLRVLKSGRSLCIRGSGVNTKFFYPSKKQTLNKDGKIKILFPSRILKEKGILELIKACHLLKKENYDYTLFIAGDIQYIKDKKLLNDFRKLLQGLSVEILGEVSNMKSIYKDMDLVILPSWREGLSKALLEAASMQKGIITTNTPGCSDIVIHGETGLVVPIKQPESIFLAVKLFIKYPVLIEKFGQAARKRVLKKFSSSIINNQTIKLYSSLLEV
tara:strand:- start:333 stop:1469 length:1137 start_codon:yes stop_codon:yes gene_type:complete